MGKVDRSLWPCATARRRFSTFFVSLRDLRDDVTMIFNFFGCTISWVQEKRLRAANCVGVSMTLVSP